MKTKTKITLLVSFIISLTFSIAYPQTGIPIAIKVPLAEAIKSPAFAQAIHQQLDKGFLLKESRGIKYIAVIYFNTLEYKVVGTYEEWNSFFMKYPTYTKVNEIANIKPKL